MITVQVKGEHTKADIKYKEALALYSDSELSISEICKQVGVGISAFSTYLSKKHRDLILKRHNLATSGAVSLRGTKGQTTEAHNRYRDAILACDSMEYIEYNISQIARIFEVSPSSLLGQLRRHYSEIVPRREKQRQRMGITANLQYGARKCSRETYAEAIDLLQSSDMTINEVADVCRVSYAGLREHIIAYYPQITQQRQMARAHAKGRKRRGQRNGSWMLYEPNRDCVKKYERAVDLYSSTAEDVKEIARLCGVSVSGFRHYLRTWYPELMVQRRGYDDGVDYKDTKRYKKSTAEKYAEAINRLKTSDLPTAKVAAEFDLHPEVFRMYLKEHHPELVAARGRMKTPDGRVVSCRSAEKYAEALRLYTTTGESLKSIAARLGLVYNSVSGFIRRNHPEAILKHRSLIAASAED